MSLQKTTYFNKNQIRITDLETNESSREQTKQEYKLPEEIWAVRFENDKSALTEISNYSYNNVKNKNNIVLENTHFEINGQRYAPPGGSTRYSVFDYGGTGSYTDKTCQSTYYEFNVGYGRSGNIGRSWTSANYVESNRNLKPQNFGLPTIFDKVLHDKGGESDQIRFHGIDPSMTYVSVKGNDFCFLLGNKGTIVIKGQLANNGHQIERLKFGDVVGRHDYDLVEVARFAQRITKILALPDFDTELNLQSLINSMASFPADKCDISAEMKTTLLSPQPQITVAHI